MSNMRNCSIVLHVDVEAVWVEVLGDQLARLDDSVRLRELTLRKGLSRRNESGVSIRLSLSSIACLL